MKRQQNFSLLSIVAGLVVICAPWFGIAWAQELDKLLEDGGDSEAELEAMLGVEKKNDYALIRASHLSMLTGWEHVRHVPPERGETNAPCHWQDDHGMLRPLDDKPIATLIETSEAGLYRVSLRRETRFGVDVPIVLSLTPQKPETRANGATQNVVYADAGGAQEHVYGRDSQVSGAASGKAIEKKVPIRFERETDLIGMPSAGLPAWEHWDVELKKGVYRAGLSAADKRARANALFMSRSRDYRPNLAQAGGDRTLGRIYMRFRAADTPVASGTVFAVSASLGYHWRGRRAKGATEDSWYWPIGRTDGAALGTWTPYLDATDAIVPGPGPWSTCNLGVSGIRDGMLEVQFAWYPHEGATALAFKTGLGNGAAIFRVPHGRWLFTPAKGKPAWGLWDATRLGQVMPQETINERYFAWADDAIARLGLKPDHPRLKHLRVFASCGVLPPNTARAAEMLARLGINWIAGAPPEIVRKYGLIDEDSSYNNADADGMAQRMSAGQRARLTKVKIGDEISTHTPPAAINESDARRHAFRAYLAEQAALEGMSLEAFVGIADPKNIACLEGLSDNPGRFERRLFYHTQRFCHLTTCENYRGIIGAFARNFPNARVYNNYSPHPVFLTGSTMNDGDWFVLCRNKAQTLGWGEDWATWGGWGLHSAYQCVSFYAALVECSARKHGYPAGFYVGSNCGGSAQKIFSCIAMGVTWLHLYDWGPIDRWAEGSNAWSENPGEYYSILCATAALGPADEIIGQGRREPRRTAILYNRSHEILQGGAGRLNHDWMWTFFGLKSSQVPVELVIEEDLNPQDLARYDCLVIGGYNLARRHVGEVRRWVENGGLLVGAGGAANCDVYGDSMPETAELFGARQRIARAQESDATARVKFPATDQFPETEMNLSGPRFILEPVAGKPLAEYAGGGCAAVANPIGKGNAILLGFQPGFAVRDNGGRVGKGRAWLAAPFLKRLGRQRVEFEYASSEATLFEHEKGLAVMLAGFGGSGIAGSSLLSVRADRPVKEVVSSLRGPLEWQLKDGRIEIKITRIDPVDVVILR